MTEFDDVIELLQANRPTATEMELDQIKQRVRQRVARPSRRKQDMKSRLAILSVLVLGMLFSTTGAGLAVQGFVSDDASVAQYGQGEEKPPGGVLGDEESGSADTGGAGDVQPTRQVEVGASGGDQLPFTGFLAIPVLLVGVALLGTGLVLRRQVGRDS